MLELEAARLLTAQAKLLGISKAKYASAAISYFGERGLDPVHDRAREGAIIQHKLHKLEEELSKQLGMQMASLGDRLFGFLRNHERALFGFLTEQEANVFTPMVQELVRASVEAFYARRVAEQVLTKQFDRYNTYPEVHQKQTKEILQVVDERLREFIPSASTLKAKKSRSGLAEDPADSAISAANSAQSATQGAY